MKKSAFTLVELMVAMAIIGVLLGLAVFGVSAAQKAQRNTERKAALQDINLGIQQYVDSTGTSPSTINFYTTGGACVGFAGGSAAACGAGNGKWVPLKGAAVPSNSQQLGPSATVLTGGSANNSAYGFYVNCTGGYSLAVCLEGNTTAFDVGTCTSTTTYVCPTI